MNDRRSIVCIQKTKWTDEWRQPQPTYRE